MARGDQIYAMREVAGIPYEHHGIDRGDGSVIHYSKQGEAVIKRTTLAAFARGGVVRVKPQPTAFIPSLVIERAESRLGEREYDLFFNNCEHFANWCKTGRRECAQLDDFGLNLERVKLPAATDLVRQAALSAIGKAAGRPSTDESPQKTSELFQTALENVAIATRTLLPAYEQATRDRTTWHQVAQRALGKDREDLARAALYKKVAADKKATDIKDKLSQLSDLQLSLEQNQMFLQKN
ncbi:lecithin retinol acyltransferase family protein [cf. Phormidesmis sp. LEGE 11477]|uniref:lecithin retinol acyltransferase family protein n=1 Tax=cf. Phormidesmis sp. LEGE 11477 TaxID=1828680 RepID=UPI0018816974|nr:lecithin retinol acyltransferase family protein [cf. Phormidesmis sp. LEGE 11477]MBE9063855.1 lecithin retinol acyltransferase family protein [cf. Phormidesmis sp. LEGE 11477]